MIRDPQPFPAERRAPRIPAYMSGRYERGFRFSEGTVRDLSTLGAFIATQHVDVPGCEGSLMLRCPTYRYPFRIPCRVVHTRRGEGCGIGLEFSDVPDSEAKEAIELYCADFAASQRVVAVDDDATILRLLKHVIEPTGAKFIGIDQPIDAADVLAELAPAVVILDMRMPGMSGIELAQRIRANAATRQIPILFYSASSPSKLPADLADITFVQKATPIANIIAAVRAAIDTAA